ncbi:MAG: hypothetical protein V7709_11860 [Halioglobus sp.]
MNTAGLKKCKNVIAALGLAFCAGVANGQPDTTQEDSNIPPPGEPSDVERQATPKTEATPVPVPVPETLPVPDQSPFDYRSSEEISEDRSVSFPVDI